MILPLNHIKANKPQEKCISTLSLGFKGISAVHTSKEHNIEMGIFCLKNEKDEKPDRPKDYSCLM